MNLVLLLLVGVGGAIGAVCRAALVDRLDANRTGWFPRGTFCVNCVACLGMGVFLGLGLDACPQALFMTGFCGGFSTLSSVNLDAVKLLMSGDKAVKSVGYLAATYVAAVLCVALGFFVAA